MSKEKKINYSFSKMKGILERPEPLNNFARDRMGQVKHFLEGRENYNCPSSCKHCCYGSILMSYTEFTFIMMFIQKNWSEDYIEWLLEEKIGLLQEDHRYLLCPFLQENVSKEHCLVYPARPLICRVFGTTAAECGEQIVPSYMEEEILYHAHKLLYYSGEQFIALNLDEKISLFEAPFTLWCLADDSSESRNYLTRLIEKKKHSFQGVLYENKKHSFYVLENGYKKILSSHRFE